MITQELFDQAKACKTVEELLALAQGNNMEMTEEQAKMAFDKLNVPPGILSEEELENVAGGCPGSHLDLKYFLDW